MLRHLLNAFEIPSVDLYFGKKLRANGFVPMENWNAISYRRGCATKNVAVGAFDPGPLVRRYDPDQEYLAIIGEME